MYLSTGDQGFIVFVERSSTPWVNPEGSQLARNDKAAASGRMTAARQHRGIAACASSNAVRPTFYAGNASCQQPEMFG